MRAWALSQRFLAAAALVACTPLLVVLALLVRLDSPGSILYRASRVGQGGRLITVHKVRTMTGASPGSGSAITAPIDPRITRLGRHLRRSRLDELPQLWDVVRGSMLLVGPRPEDPSLVDLDDPRWREVLSIPPGITGATQLRFHDEGRWVDTADPLGSYRTRILPLKLKSDLGYVRGRSARGDVRILLESVRLAFQREAPTHDPT